jgi:hypothetical protein
LAQSIEEDEFWDGAVCRRANSRIEIASYHHRVEAAKKTG